MPTKSARARPGNIRKSGWQTIQSKKRIAQKTKLAAVVFLLIFGLLFMAQLVKLTKALYSPWGGSRINRSFSWQGDFNINLALLAKGISLLIFIPKDQKIILINLPDSIYLEATHGFGRWMLSSVYGVGQSQKDLGGGQLLKDSIRNLFGLPVDGFLDFSSGKFSEKTGREIINNIRENPFGGFNLLTALKTDLTPLELLRLKLGSSAVRFDKVWEIDLTSLGVLDQERLADGSLVSSIDPIKLDTLLADVFDPVIKSEHKTVAVFNATDQPQLAQKWARLLTNIGADVIIVANSQNKLKTTKVTGEQSKTLDRLKQIFEPACSGGKDRDICGKINPQLDSLSSSRAQINIFLGEDFSWL